MQLQLLCCPAWLCGAVTHPAVAVPACLGAVLPITTRLDAESQELWGWTWGHLCPHRELALPCVLLSLPTPEGFRECLSLAGGEDLSVALSLTHAVDWIQLGDWLQSGELWLTFE